MGEFTDKVSGAINQAIGGAKQDVTEKDPAYRTDEDRRVEAEGAGQELKGDLQELKGKVKGAINDL